MDEMTRGDHDAGRLSLLCSMCNPVTGSAATLESNNASHTETERPNDHRSPQRNSREGVDHLIVAARIFGSQITCSHDLLLLNSVPIGRDVELFIPTGRYYGKCFF